MHTFKTGLTPLYSLLWSEMHPLKIDTLKFYFHDSKKPPVWVDLQAQVQWTDSISAISVEWFEECWPSFLAHTALNHGTWPGDKSAS